MAAPFLGRRATFLNVLPALLLVSCSGSPAGPAPTDLTLTILSPADVIRVGASVDMRLQVTYSDGRYASITPLWSTDRPEIVNVKPLSASRQVDAGELWDVKTGPIDHILFARVTGIAPGQAIVVAQCSHGTVRQPIRVTAN